MLDVTPGGKANIGIGDYVDKAKDLVSGNKDKVKDGIDKAADVVDEKTGGEHT
jgi:hypothetical protein